jgi:hypothetical protein
MRLAIVSLILLFQDGGGFSVFCSGITVNRIRTALHLETLGVLLVLKGKSALGFSQLLPFF